MNKFFKLSAFAGFGLAVFVPALAQSPAGCCAKASVTPNVRVLSPEVSRSLRITAIPAPTPHLVVGTYWLCEPKEDGFDCGFKLVVCTDDQETCVQIPIL